MTTLSDRENPMELNLQPIGSTGVYYYAPVLFHLDVVAHCVFAAATPCSTLPKKALPAAKLPLPEPPATDRQARTLPVLDAVDDLKTWLNLSYDDLARLFGWQSASNIHHWRRCARANEPIQPRATTVEPILRLHALLRAVSETISGEDSTAVQLWARTPLDVDDPTPLELLEEGRIEDLERRANRLLFGLSATAPPAWRLLRPIEGEELTDSSRQPDYRPEDFG